MTAKHSRSRGGRIGFLSFGLLLLAWTGCEPETCTSSAACGPGEICAARGTDPYRCLLDCTQEDRCSFGFTCAGVADADCPACQVVINACVADWP